MKNKILAIVCIAALISGFSINATKAQYFEKGDKVLNIGLGFGSALYVGGDYNMRFPVLSGSFDMGILDDIGIGNIGAGGYIGITGSKTEYSNGSGTYGTKYTYFVIGARATYHFVDIADKVDLYGGVMPSYTFASHTNYGTGNYTNTDTYGPYYHVTIFGGIRYYVSKNFALMAEAGYGISFLNLGIALKL